MCMEFLIVCVQILVHPYETFTTCLHTCFTLNESCMTLYSYFIKKRTNYFILPKIRLKYILIFIFYLTLENKQALKNLFFKHITWYYDILKLIPTWTHFLTFFLCISYETCFFAVRETWRRWEEMGSRCMANITWK